MIDRPVFVNSIPKSGTYLLAAILEELGLEFTHWHVFETFYDDYTDAPLDVARAYPERFRIRQPVGRTISHLRPGQFAVGHLCYNERTRRALEGCYVIFLKRDLRECLVSHMRWQAATGRDRSAWRRIEDPQQRLLAYLSKWGRSFINRASAIASWNNEADQVLKFEEIYCGFAGEKLNETAKDYPQIVRRAIRSRTLTRMPRSEWSQFWSDGADVSFRSLKGHEVNAAIGYAGVSCGSSCGRAARDRTECSHEC